MTPKARKHQFLVHHVDDEIVVYDKERKRAHRLNATAALVGSSLDGDTPTSDIADDLHGNPESASAFGHPTC